MRASPLVSTVMINPNRERFVCAATESACAQSFEDGERIVVENGKTFSCAKRRSGMPAAKPRVNEHADQPDAVGGDYRSDAKADAASLGKPSRLNITIPVFNEERNLAASVHALSGFVSGLGRFEYEIVIADNGSIDGTAQIALRLVESIPQVRLVRLPEKGRGRALRKVWSESEADILSYMDVDLSTDLSAFPELIDSVAGGGFDLAVGSRLAAGSRVKRGWKREIVSRVYNRLVKTCFRTTFSDAQCGFKAIGRQCAQQLLPITVDNQWFFDTELLVVAEKTGRRIHEVPVHWVDDPDSRVKIVRTAIADLKGMIRLRRSLRKFYCGSSEENQTQIKNKGGLNGRCPPPSRLPKKDRYGEE